MTTLNLRVRHAGPPRPRRRLHVVRAPAPPRTMPSHIHPLPLRISSLEAEPHMNDVILAEADRIINGDRQRDYGDRQQSSPSTPTRHETKRPTMPDPAVIFATVYSACCVIAAWWIHRRWPR